MKVAAKQHTDMIVMGAKGLSAIDRILLGERIDAGGAVCGLPRARGSIMEDRRGAHRMSAFTEGLEKAGDTRCIQDPSATDGETHARGYATPKFSGADH